MELPAEIRSLIEGLQRRIETLAARVAELERENAALAGGERRFEAPARPRQFDEFEAAVERRLEEEASEPSRAIWQGERRAGWPQGRYAQAGRRSGPDRPSRGARLPPLRRRPDALDGAGNRDAASFRPAGEADRSHRAPAPSSTPAPAAAGARERSFPTASRRRRNMASGCGRRRVSSACCSS